MVRLAILKELGIVNNQEILGPYHPQNVVQTALDHRKTGIGVFL